MARSIGLAAVALALAGCGGSGGPAKTYPVTGTVTFKGQPCGGALVVFHPSEKGRENDPKPVATTKDDGTFTLSTFGENDGAPAGAYGVTVVWNVAAKVGKLSLSSESSASTDKLGGRYGDPRNPKFKASVTAEGPNRVEFKVD